MKNKPGWFLISTILFFLAACSGAATPKPTGTAIDTPSPAPSSTVYPTDTPTLAPTATSPSLTPTSTSPGPQTIRTSCAIDQPGLFPTFAIPPTDPLFAFVDFAPQPILDFLNAGGSRQAVIDYIKQSERVPDEFLLQEDLNNDHIPELIVVGPHLRIYTCQSQRYYAAADIESNFTRDTPNPILFQDMNADGLPEILLEMRYRDAVDIVYGYQILEWNGQTFQNLIFPEDHSDYTTHTYMMKNIENGWVELGGRNWQLGEFSETLPAPWSVIDTDHNGTLELVLTGGIFLDQHIDLAEYGHQRKTKTTVMWDGKHFVIQDTEYSPAEFRFQAVQDADYATLKGQYNKALNLYQNVISSNTLEWWSYARGRYNFAQAEASWDNNIPTPTPPAPDLTERPYLSAYAYYRIMVLKVLQGEVDQAKNTYQTLRTKFPAGKPGAAYTELASAFWDEYKATQSIGNACHEAIKYATANKSAILHFIGELNYHPLPSLSYEPEDICPFK